MRARPAFLQFDWLKASLSMDLPVFIYSHTKTGINFFQDRKDIGSFFMCLEIFYFKPCRENSQGSCFVWTEVCQGLLIIEIVIFIHYFIVSSLCGWVMQLGLKSVQSALSDLKRPPEHLQSQCNYQPFIT